uniref:Uncharacterized protein n=1 Tax=viral metagenome TaxID=1070528 RepID=A0A6C0J2L9_9ZZZZ
MGSTQSLRHHGGSDEYIQKQEKQVRELINKEDYEYLKTRFWGHTAFSENIDYQKLYTELINSDNEDKKMFAETSLKLHMLIHNMMLYNDKSIENFIDELSSNDSMLKLFDYRTLRLGGYIDIAERSDFYNIPNRDYIIGILTKLKDIIENKPIQQQEEEKYVPSEQELNIINLIKDKNLEGLKKLMFQYMKYAVNGDEDSKNIEYQDIYDGEDDDETIKKALNAVEAHDIYSYIILFGENPRDDEDYIEDKDKLKNALDIKPYLDYVNSDEYVHPEKDVVIKEMNHVRDLLGFTAIQQVGRGHRNQHGGMWQRGGFFMTCS